MAAPDAAAAPRRPAAEDDDGSGMVSPAGVGLPDMSIHEEGAQTTTKRKQLDPAFTQDIEDQRAGGQAEVEAKVAQRGIDIAKAGLTGQEAGEAAQQAQDALERTQQERAHQDQLIAERQAESARRRAEMEKAAKPTTYWEDKGKPAELFSIFMTGLSDSSNVRAGGKPGESPLQKQYDLAISKDEAQKLRNFENSKYYVELADKDVELAKKAKADRIAEIKDESVVMGDVLAKRFKAYASRLGTQEAAAKADEAIGLLQKTNAEKIAEKDKERNVDVDTTGPKTSTTTNIKTTPKGEKTAGATEVEKREALVDTEKATSDIAKLAKTKPGGVVEFQKLMREWNVREGNEKVPYFGPLGKAAIEAFGASTTRDELFKDASPEAKQLYELFMHTASAKAKARGGAITKEDQATVMDELGLLGKTPEEISKAADGYAKQALRQRTSLETNIKYKDKGAVGSDAKSQEGKDAALANLVRVTGIKGVGKAAIEEMAKKAKEAGVPDELIEGLVRKARK